MLANPPTPPTRQDLALYSDPTPSSDGDFTAHQTAWVFHYPPRARDMCSRKTPFIHSRAAVVRDIRAVDVDQCCPPQGLP